MQQRVRVHKEVTVKRGNDMQHVLQNGKVGRLVGGSLEASGRAHLGICELVKLIALESQSTLSLAESLSDLICALQTMNLVRLRLRSTW